MIGRIITYQGASYGLLVAPPNWDTEVTVALELPTDISKEPITFQESRRNFAASVRYKLTYTCYLSNAADSTELRLFLTRLRGESMFVPMWTDGCEMLNAESIGATSIELYDLPVRYGTTWIIGTPDFSTYEIVTVSNLNTSTLIATTSALANAWPAGTIMYPLLLGRFDERPQPEAISDETLEVEFTIKENSQFAYRLTPTTVTLSTVGSHIPSFASLPKWDVSPNYVRPLDWTEMPDVVYEHIGFLREEQQRAYDHRNQRGLEFEFYQNVRADLNEVEYFWRDRRATTLRFMVPTFRGDLRLLSDTGSITLSGRITMEDGTSLILLEDGSGGLLLEAQLGSLIICEKSFFSNPGREIQPGDPYIALIPQNGFVDPYQVSVTDLPQETDLTATIAVASYPASSTIVSHLLLARFAESTLEWSYITPYLGTTKIKFIELPHEYSILPAALPEPAYLFIFTEVGIQTNRFTSYENTITVPSGTYAGTYTPAPFSFDTVKVGLRLDQERLDFKSFKFTGNPLNKMWPFALDGILTLEIVEVDATNPSSTTAISRFFGDVWSIQSDYKATAIPFGNLFDRKFPRFLLSVSDNYSQFSEPTKISASSFAYSGTISSAINVLSQTITINSSGAFAQLPDYFAGGWLDTGTGVNAEHRGILSSSPSVSPNVTLYIDRPLIKATTGQAVTFYPGYDASIDQCDLKFNNRINFGGHPYIPNINPGVKAIKPKDTAGGKKL
jgi:hypothetical protein